MALTDNLVSFWELEEASGTRNDSHSSNHLTDVNTVTQATGKVGQAAQFTAANSEYLSRASNADLQMGDIGFTIAAWIYKDNDQVGQVVAKDAAGGRDYTLDSTIGGIHRFYVNGTIIASVTGTASGVWAYLIAWHDPTADTVNISLNNGTPVSTTSLGTAPVTSSTSFRIGAREYASFEEYFNGRIDQVGLWKRVLTSGERTELYNSGAGLSYAGMGGGAFKVSRIHLNQAVKRASTF